MSEPIIGAIYRCTNEDFVPYNCLVEVIDFDDANVYYTYVELTKEAKHTHHRTVGGKNNVSFDNFQEHFILEVEPEEIPEEIPEVELIPTAFTDLFTN